MTTIMGLMVQGHHLPKRYYGYQRWSHSVVSNPAPSANRNRPCLPSSGAAPREKCARIVSR